MSFILDALKKSETDRQRQSAPALFGQTYPPAARSVVVLFEEIGRREPPG